MQNTPQQDVSDDGGNIVIAPANPEVVYVPVYNPWGVYGAPIGIYPGYYYGPPAGVYFGAGLGIGFGIGIGIGIGIGMWSHWGWGWHNWGFNWRDRAVWYHGGRYYTHSRTVYNRGFNRPGGPRGHVYKESEAFGLCRCSWVYPPAGSAWVCTCLFPSLPELPQES